MRNILQIFPFYKLPLFMVLAIVFTISIADEGVPTSLSEFKATTNSEFDATVNRYFNNDVEKILGGLTAPDGKYPWQVSLGVAWINNPAKAHFCGGSIVNEQWIRTAAHCVVSLQKNQVLIAYGSNKLSSSINRLSVETMFYNKDYDKPKKHDNDIALVKLTKPLTFSQKLKPIDLAPSSYILEEGHNLDVSGWGATKEGGSGQEDLRYVSVPFVTNKDCNDPLSYEGAVTENMICAGKSVGGKDSCQGDSGGPLVDLSGKNPIQVGVVSWGKGCARPGMYGIYADGRRYHDWEKQCIDKPENCQ